MKSERYVTAVWMECCLLEPDWCSERTLFSVTGTRPVELEFHVPLFWILEDVPRSGGNCGILPVEKVKSIRYAIGFATSWAASFNCLVGIPSSPGGFC